MHLRDQTDFLQDEDIIFIIHDHWYRDLAEFSTWNTNLAQFTITVPFPFIQENIVLSEKKSTSHSCNYNFQLYMQLCWFQNAIITMQFYIVFCEVFQPNLKMLQCSKTRFDEPRISSSQRRINKNSPRSFHRGKLLRACAPQILYLVSTPYLQTLTVNYNLFSRNRDAAHEKTEIRTGFNIFLRKKNRKFHPFQFFIP